MCFEVSVLGIHCKCAVSQIVLRDLMAERPLLCLEAKMVEGPGLMCLCS